MVVRSSRNPKSFEQALAALNAASIDAFNRGDARACAECYEERATLLFRDEPPIKGCEAIAALFGKYLSKGVKLAAIDLV